MLAEARPRLSEAALIASNIVVLLLILSSRADPVVLIFVYWAESLVIGFFSLARMLVISGRVMLTGNNAARLMSIFGLLFMVPFFTVHYGAFMLGHFLFLKILFMQDATFTYLFEFMLVPLGVLFTSHLISFLTNFIGRREYRKISANRVMSIMPYTRIIIMNVLIIFTGFVHVAYPKFSGIVFASLLTMVKTVADLYSHRREHARSWKKKSLQKMK